MKYSYSYSFECSCGAHGSCGFGVQDTEDEKGLDSLYCFECGKKLELEKVKKEKIENNVIVEVIEYNKTKELADV